MIGRKERWQEDLFVACPLSHLIPEDHILKRVDRVLDLSWLRTELRDLYDEEQGRPAIDPESAVRLMLAGLFQGIVHDRRLMREAQVNLAIRWFAGYRLQDKLLESLAKQRGATYLRNPLWQPIPRAVSGFFSGAKPTGLLFSVHPLGGCAMADDVAHGVVDHMGRVFDLHGKDVHPGLLVLDGAIVPTALGIGWLVCGIWLGIAALHARRKTSGAAADARSQVGTRSASTSTRVIDSR